MQVFLVFTLISFTFAASIYEETEHFHTYPCYWCSADYIPVCAVPVRGGAAQTFDNTCLVSAEDCGLFERRKFKSI